MSEDVANLNGLTDLMEPEITVAPAFEVSERPLYNGTQPAYNLQKEKYEHRIVAHLKAAGNTDLEIARITGYSAAAIHYMVHQPWMEQMILSEIRKTGDKAMRVLQDAAAEAAETLIEVMRESENVETRRKASNDILDRKYGKPNQPYSVREVDPNSASDKELMDVITQAQQQN